MSYRGGISWEDLMHLALTVAGLTLIAGGVASEPLKVSLLCRGVGSHPASQSATAFTVGDGGTSQTTLTTNGIARSGVAFSFEIDEAGESRIQMPPELIPPISGGGQGGWWRLSDLSVSNREVRGRFGLNFLNHPTVSLDRTTGIATVSGFGLSITGTCQKIDPTQRVF